MSKLDNINYNKINIKTDSMVKMIEQLAKLGVFKEKKKSKARRASTNVDEVKQPSVMDGYTKQIPLLRTIEPNMTRQQIDDIQQRNAAQLAALQGEISQQRLQDIEAQQGQRFADIEKLGGIINPLLERFRGAQEAGAGQRPDPFKTEQPQLLPEPIDIEEGLFTQTLNEGGPDAKSQTPTTIFTKDEEDEGIPVPPRLAPREPIKEGGGDAPRKSKSVNLRRAVTDSYGLPPIPQFKGTNTQEMLSYYRQFMDTIGYDIDPSITRSKEKMFAAINAAADELALTISK